MLRPLGNVFVCPEAVTSIFTCNVTNQLRLQWMVGLEDSTIDTKFFTRGSLATVASSGGVPFMAILDHVSGTSLSSTLTVQLNRTSHRVIIVKCSDVQSNEAVSLIMPAGMNGGQIRGHIQTICEKINVIMTLTPHPPPPPPPALASYRTITFMKVERLQSFTLLRDSIPTTQSHFFYSSVVST